MRADSFAAIIGGIAAVITALLAGKKIASNNSKAENITTNLKESSSDID